MSLQRTQDVARLLSIGKARWQILQFAAENEWGISERQVDTYIQKANKMLEEDFALSRQQFTARKMAELISLQDEARQKNQLHVALGCITMQAKITKIVE